MRDDIKFNKELLDYEEIKASEIKEGDYLRITKNIYRKYDRKILFVLVKGIDSDGTLTVNGFKEKYPDYQIKPYDKNKQFNFYKKKQVVYPQNTEDEYLPLSPPKLVRQ